MSNTKYRSGLLILAAVLTWPTVALPQTRALNRSVGFRDNILLGLSLGTMSGPVAGFQSRLGASTALRLEGSWGAGVATWGIAEQWQLTGSLITRLSDDGTNDALLLEPGASYGVMYGDSERGFIDFRPGANVHFIALDCALAWLHEYSSWSTELALGLGAAMALAGANPGQAVGWGGGIDIGARAQGESSLRLNLTFLAHF